ncbi:MAG: membrane dipeptidase [Saprospiraceae bacterium]|nr:membrane dipeptidase [Saprospiraceae bacterium]
MNFKLFLTLCITGLIACSTPKERTSNPNENNFQKAIELSQKFIITDGHVDLPYRLKVQNFRLEKEYLGIPISTDKGDFDYSRAKSGGLDAPFMSIFVPARLQSEPGASKDLADSLINMVEGIIQSHPKKFGKANSPDEVVVNYERGMVSLPMGMENGSPIEDDISNVAYFKKRGISYITLTHSKNNQICDSSYDTTRIWQGLSPFGEEVVKEMNRVGIMIDISHVSDSTFFDVMKLTKSPVIASHSSCRHFTPGFERNMSDPMLKALKVNGGVIMINFGSSFIDQKVQEDRDSLMNIYQMELDSNNVERGSDQATLIRNNIFNNNPVMWSDISVVADHIDHVVKIAGIDHVGFGSDFDGVGDSLPKGLKDVSDYPNLIKILLDRGYSEKDIEKICFGNLRRVWEKVLANAEKT